MAIPVIIPGIGTVMMDTQADADRALAVLDILTLEGDITHTNLDTRAVGTEIDPFVVNKESIVGPLGFNRAKLAGYTELEWTALFGNSQEYNPSSNASVSFKDDTASPIDRAKAVQDRGPESTIYIEEFPTETNNYTLYQYEQKFGPIDNTQGGGPWGALGTIFTPGSMVPIDWSCGPMGGQTLVDRTNICMGCPDSFCDDAVNCGPGLATVTAPCVNDLPPGPPPANWGTSGNRLLGYISEPMHGLTNRDIRNIRFKACDESFCGGGSCCQCTDTATGQYCTGQLHYFAIMLDNINNPALNGSVLINRNNYIYTQWDEFILDIIANTGYGGTPADSLHDFKIWLQFNDPTLLAVPLHTFIGTTQHLCSPGQPGQTPDCPPIIPVQVPSWVGLSCDPVVLNAAIFDCNNATGACYSNNSDGSIVWSIHCLDPLPASTGPNAYYEWSVTDANAVVVHAGIYDGAAGTVTQTVGTGIVSTMPPNDFTQSNFQTNGLAGGTYTCNIFNFTGGGNNYGSYNISGIVLNDPEQNCIINDPLYNANCCPPPPPPPPPEPDEEPDHECPCEGAENCEECGNQGINFKS
tara:strand:- start:9460 stop:11202 length:1743 start_codon:yes stop_codon:yes gene_type:complete